MTREEFLKMKVMEKGINLKAIALEIDVPYSTVRDMQANVGSARIDNVIKLCKFLGITVEELSNPERCLSPEYQYTLTDHEKEVITAYRSAEKALQDGIDRMLGIEPLVTEQQAKKIG